MPRGPADPARLRSILHHLRREPRPILSAIKSLNLTYAVRNDHFGARHFAKEELPRIAYSNPELRVSLHKIMKKPEETLTPVMQVTLHDGSEQTINLDKHSDMILQGLLEINDMAVRKGIRAKQPELTSAA